MKIQRKDGEVTRTRMVEMERSIIKEDMILIHGMNRIRIKMENGIERMLGVREDVMDHARELLL